MALIGNNQVILSPLNGPVGASGIFSGPTVIKGMMETPAFDAGQYTNFAMQADIQRTNTPVVTSATQAGSLQMEASNDGNAWVVLSTPAAIAITVESSNALQVTAKAMRYYKARYILTGGGTISALQTFSGTAPGAAVVGIAFTPDGLFVGMAVATAVNLDIYPFAQTTTSLGTQVTGTAGGGTPASNAIAVCPLPLGSSGSNYYFALAGGTTPFGGVVPLTSGGVVGTPIALPQALPGAGKDVSWHPSGQFIIFGGSTTPFLTCFSFNPATGQFGSVQALGQIPACGNLTCAKFSPDGNFLLVAGATTTQAFQVFPVVVTPGVGGGLPTLTLGAALANPGNMPAAAVLAGQWHPTGNRFGVITSSTTGFFEYPLYRASINPNNPFLGGAVGFIGPRVPTTTIVAPLGFRYSPDGAWVAFVNATTAFLQIFPLKDVGTACGTVQTAPTAMVTASQYNDAVWSPNMQYLVVGGTGGAVFQNVFPWIFAVQLGVSVTGGSTT